MRIGILGGTFNPVHTGHLVLAEQAKELLRLDKVIFIPTFLAPHKKHASDIVDAGHRLKMLRLAIRGNPHFELSSIELDRKGISYSIETLRVLRSMYNKAKLFLLVGADERIDTWREAKYIPDLCDIVIANRPYEKNVKYYKTDIRHMEIEITNIGVSSSLIRRYLRKSKSVRYLLSDKVYSYIIQKKLYRL